MKLIRPVAGAFLALITVTSLTSCGQSTEDARKDAYTRLEQMSGLNKAKQDGFYDNKTELSHRLDQAPDTAAIKSIMGDAESKNTEGLNVIEENKKIIRERMDDAQTLVGKTLTSTSSTGESCEGGSFKLAEGGKIQVFTKTKGFCSLPKSWEITDGGNDGYPYDAGLSFDGITVNIEHEDDGNIMFTGVRRVLYGEWKVQ